MPHGHRGTLALATMGNTIAVMILHSAKFEKQPSTQGISRDAYVGRIMHALFNMADIAVIEVDSDEEESVYGGGEGMSSGEDELEDSVFGDEDREEVSELESRDCLLVEGCCL